jgi:lipopolysaccharide biosynthesis regulator YciM
MAVMYWMIAALVLCALVPISKLWRKKTLDQRRLAGRCVACGYDIRGIKWRCPECGRAIGR